jgi:hypothetical protein
MYKKPSRRTRGPSAAKSNLRARRTTLSPSVINKLIDTVGDLVYKVFDRFNALTKDEVVFLEKQGFNTQKYFDLMDKRKKLNASTPILLHEVITEIVTLHEERNDFYISRSKYIINQMSEIKKNSELYAINEIKRKRKSIYDMNKIKYGFFKARKETFKYFKDINLEEKFNELMDEKMKNSNYYDMIKDMRLNISNEYKIENLLFQCCLDKLHKEYKKLYPSEFKIFANNSDRPLLEFKKAGSE